MMNHTINDEIYKHIIIAKRRILKLNWEEVQVDKTSNSTLRDKLWLIFVYNQVKEQLTGIQIGLRANIYNIFSDACHRYIFSSDHK